jgi:hypothetical protein
MIADEIGLAPPSCSWHLPGRKEELALIFGNDGSSFCSADGSTLLGLLSPSKMMGKRDVSALLYRLIEDELLARCILPAASRYGGPGLSRESPRAAARSMISCYHRG